MGAFRLAALVVRLATAVVVLHGLEILLWAGFYRWRCLPSWNSAALLLGKQLFNPWLQ
jgi:voltage-gated potassium channel